MKSLGLLFIISVVVEALIEYFEFLFDFIEDERIRKIVKQVTALVIAEVFSFQLEALILTPLVSALGGSVSVRFDMVIAGIFCSRGANYLSDIIRLIYSVGTQARESVNDDGFWNMFDFEDGDEDGTSSEENEN